MVEIFSCQQTIVEREVLVESVVGECKGFVLMDGTGEAVGWVPGNTLNPVGSVTSDSLQMTCWRCSISRIPLTLACEH